MLFVEKYLLAPPIALFAWLISHQPAVLFSHNKPATSNQPAVLFTQNKPAPAISHRPTEQAGCSKSHPVFTAHILRVMSYPTIASCGSSLSRSDVDIPHLCPQQ
jgi:hypothetical protein